MKTTLVNIRVVGRAPGAYDLYIGRGDGPGGKWGNPFTEGRDGDRRAVVRKYRDYILSRPDLLADLHELRGKVLACWCYPKLCHGMVLLALLKERFPDDETSEILADCLG